MLQSIHASVVPTRITLLDITAPHFFSKRLRRRVVDQDLHRAEMETSRRGQPSDGAGERTCETAVLPLLPYLAPKFLLTAAAKVQGRRPHQLGTVTWLCPPLKNPNSLPWGDLAGEQMLSSGADRCGSSSRGFNVAQSECCREDDVESFTWKMNRESSVVP